MEIVCRLFIDRVNRAIHTHDKPFDRDKSDAMFFLAQSLFLNLFSDLSLDTLATDMAWRMFARNPSEPP